MCIEETSVSVKLKYIMRYYLNKPTEALVCITKRHPLQYVGEPGTELPNQPLVGQPALPPKQQPPQALDKLKGKARGPAKFVILSSGGLTNQLPLFSK